MDIKAASVGSNHVIKTPRQWGCSQRPIYSIGEAHKSPPALISTGDRVLDSNLVLYLGLYRSTPMCGR